MRRLARRMQSFGDSHLGRRRALDRPCWSPHRHDTGRNFLHDNAARADSGLVSDVRHDHGRGPDPAIGSDPDCQAGSILGMRKTALRIAAMLMTAGDLNMRGDLCSGADLYVGDDAITSDS